MLIANEYRKFIPILVLFGLIFIIFILIGRVIAYRKAFESTTYNNNYELLTSISIAEKRIDGFKQKEILEIQTAHAFVPNHLVFDINTGDSVYLQNIIKTSTILYRFTQSSCLDCVIQDIESLNLIRDRIREDNIIVIGGYESNRAFKAFASSLEMKFRCFNYLPPLNVPLQTEENGNNVPFFMVVRPTLEILFPYSRDDKTQNDKYLDRISQYFEEISRSKNEYYEIN